MFLRIRIQGGTRALGRGLGMFLVAIVVIAAFNLTHEGTRAQTAQQPTAENRYERSQKSGVTAGQAGDYGTALERFRESLSDARDAQDEDKIAKATWNIALTYFHLNRYEDAI
jgi:tetratricopeptide (TPR) repeat protein